MHRAELMRIKRRTNKTIAEYITEFRVLHAKANVLDVAADLQVTWFVQGLEPEPLRRAMWTRGPRTLA